MQQIVSFKQALAENRWPAPAKINLFLHVVGKRADGYHNLQTVFQLLDFGDELHFSLNQSGKVTRSYDLGFSEESDLCLRAAKALQAYSKTNQGVEIGLTKRLPMGGGLGGGSSDAATVLLALNQLWDIGLSIEELSEIGLKLGADVPVFVGGHSAWAEGVGERLTPLKLPKKWFLVLNPAINVSTAEIFSHKHLTASTQMMKIRAFQNAEQPHFGENQLQAIVCAEYPEVNELLNWLQAFGEPRMSGSGGSVFLAVQDQQQGLEILQKRPSNVTGFVAKGLNIHPLHSN